MSGPVDLGQTYRYRHTVKDSAGVPANAGTVVVTVTLPDGTTVTPSVVNSATGIYDVSYTTTQSGLHNVFGSATGGVLSSEFDKWEDAFTVETPLRMLIGLDEAVSHLGASGIITSDADREQLRWLCLVATNAVEADLGRIIVRRSVTETYDGGGSAILLRSTPVLSITTVVDSGVTLTALDYTLAPGGILRRGATSYSGYFTSGSQSVVITYVAGYADPPRVARLAALSLVQSLYQQSQQALHPLLDESSPEAFVPAALAGLGQIPGYDSLRAVGVA